MLRAIIRSQIKDEGVLGEGLTMEGMTAQRITTKDTKECNRGASFRCWRKTEFNH